MINGELRRVLDGLSDKEARTVRGMNLHNIAMHLGVMLYPVREAAAMAEMEERTFYRRCEQRADLVCVEAGRKYVTGGDILAITAQDRMTRPAGGRETRQFAFRILGFDRRHYYWQASNAQGAGTVRTGKSARSIRQAIPLLWTESERIQYGWRVPAEDSRTGPLSGQWQENLAYELAHMRTRMRAEGRDHGEHFDPVNRRGVNAASESRRFPFEALGFDGRYYYWQASDALDGRAVRTGKKALSMRQALPLLWTEAERIQYGWRVPETDPAGDPIPGKFKENKARQIRLMVELMRAGGEDYARNPADRLVQAEPAGSRKL